MNLVQTRHMDTALLAFESFKYMANLFVSPRTYPQISPGSRLFFIWINKFGILFKTTSRKPIKLRPSPETIRMLYLRISPVLTLVIPGLTTYEIYSSFECNNGVREVFLYRSKVFAKVWHKEIIHKLPQNGIPESLSNLSLGVLLNW